MCFFYIWYNTALSRLEQRVAKCGFSALGSGSLASSHHERFGFLGDCHFDLDGCAIVENPKDGRGDDSSDAIQDQVTDHSVVVGGLIADAGFQRPRDDVNERYDGDSEEEENVGALLFSAKLGSENSSDHDDSIDEVQETKNAGKHGGSDENLRLDHGQSQPTGKRCSDESVIEGKTLALVKFVGVFESNQCEGDRGDDPVPEGHGDGRVAVGSKVGEVESLNERQSKQCQGRGHSKSLKPYSSGSFGIGEE